MFFTQLLLSCVTKETLPQHEKMIGVTVDSVENLPGIVAALKELPVKPVTRIVFDENVAAAEYKTAAKQIQTVSFVMGEILDSSAMKSYSLQAYSARTSEYLAVLDSSVDIWEIGNEINGEWLGETKTVVEKMIAAYELVKARGKPTALTLYFNEGCFTDKANETFTWARNHIPEKMKTGLDYIWLSYYEDDCNGLRPDWEKVFQKLAAMFPNSKIGFGEVGTKNSDKKAEYIERYYRMKIAHPDFVGGYFWWYFVQDMVPANRPLLRTLKTAIQ